MRRRIKAGGNAAKTHRRKAVTPNRREQPEAERHTKSSLSVLEEKIKRQARELEEAQDERAAIEDVLRIISASPSALEPVFTAILENAMRICQANIGTILRYDGERFHPVVSLGETPALREFRLRRGSFVPPVGMPLDRVLRTKAVVAADDTTEAIVPPAAKLGGCRSHVIVPMLKGDLVIGAIVIYRQEVRPFTDKQIELLQNFAAQAVIAIENARLLNELRQSLQEQTATAEILEVINSSPGDLAPVFDAILEKALRVCSATFGSMTSHNNGRLRRVTARGLPAAYENWRLEHPLEIPSVGYPPIMLQRLLAGEAFVHEPDLTAGEAYRRGHPQARALGDLGGARSAVAVALRNDDALHGTIIIFRQELRPFSDKEIRLLQNFAAQAVIAMENARLLSELRESYRVVQQQAGKLEAQSQELVKLNQQLEQRVAVQVGEIERMSRLRRFLPPQVADLIVASGSEKQLESHRGEITALFCDLRGFTGFSESSDPEDVMALLKDYHAAIGKILIKFRGTLERYAGDGVMVIFNDPVPVDNPALRAVRMALEMRDAIGMLTGRWRRLGHDIGFGIGIAHGFATLGTIGFEGRFDYAAIGTVSNVASRLCDEATSGQILISPRVLMAVEDAITVEPVGEFSLKGIRRPLAAYNVVTAKPAN
jgi:class 3 adenylate cyclase/DNA-binding FrmR family transcriptional regulator